MPDFDPERYTPAITSLIKPVKAMPLGPAEPQMAMRTLVVGQTLDSLFGGRPVKDYDMARCCHAGLMLLHDFLEDSHKVSQGIESDTGSYWHGIMHRREPDASNAKHWFVRAGDHDIHKPLAREAKRLTESYRPEPLLYLNGDGSWSPAGFVDQVHCAEALAAPEYEAHCVELQMIEWRLLFDYCYAKALG